MLVSKATSLTDTVQNTNSHLPATQALTRLLTRQRAHPAVTFGARQALAALWAMQATDPASPAEGTGAEARAQRQHWAVQDEEWSHSWG